MALEDLTAALKSATDAQRAELQRNQTELTAALEKATDAQQRNQQEHLNALRANRDTL